MNLIYTVALNDRRYLAAARIWARTLRDAGRFSGDIKIFTDLREKVEMAECVPFDGGRGFSACCCARVDVGTLIPVARYQQILYLDADIVAIADVSPLLSFIPSGVAVTPSALARLNSQYCGDCLPAAVRARIDPTEPGVNAGSFCASSKVLLDFLDKWKTHINRCSRLKPRRPWLVDQLALNSLIACKEVRSATYPLSWVSRPDMIQADTKLVHFAGRKNFALTLSRMARFL